MKRVTFFSVVFVSLTAFFSWNPPKNAIGVPFYGLQDTCKQVQKINKQDSSILKSIDSIKIATEILNRQNIEEIKLDKKNEEYSKKILSLAKRESRHQPNIVQCDTECYVNSLVPDIDTVFYKEYFVDSALIGKTWFGRYRIMTNRMIKQCHLNNIFKPKKWGKF